MNVRPSGLPIDAALPALRTALQGGSNVLLVAPPGAGKSTIVPLALLGEPWAARQRLIMLEPRRLAARAVAERMAHLLGERVGHTVGYRMRLDTRVSRHTRIEVLTEGVLTRMLQSDPALEGTAALIFDEFHERSLQADLGLALALDAQATIAPTLKLLLMSATLDVQAVMRVLGGAPLVCAEGRTFPVETRFVGGGEPLVPGGAARTSREESVERSVARIVRRALREAPGDVLVFLPGAAEIRRVRTLLAEAELEAAIRVLPLFGELASADQDAALAPDPAGARKVVLSTNIAETSLTIEGVRIVVDSGLVRRPTFDPVTGMSTLTTRRISRASAAQRQGRAGRIEPGVCYRLWSEEAHRRLAAHSSPEILEADLAPLALELATWGAREASELRWLDLPPATMLASARELLQRLGALDGEGRATVHGREMAALGVHPRLAHMLLQARELGSVALGSQLAALLSERDVLLRDAQRDADIRTRLELLGTASAGVRQPTLQRVHRSAGAIARQLGATVESDRRGAGDGAAAGTEAGVLLAFAYPDRIGLRRPGTTGRYLLTNGRGAFFSDSQALSSRELIVAVDLDDRDREARILLAAPLERSALLRHFSAGLERTRYVEWNEREQAVIAREAVQLGALTLEERALLEVPTEAARAAMLEGVRRLGLEALPWSAEVRDLQARMEFARRLIDAPPGRESKAPATSDRPAWPAVSDAALRASLEQWLAPWLEGVLRREHLARIPLRDALLALLSYGQQRELEELAPTHLTAPSGSRVRIDYLDENAPAVSVRLQEVFGLQTTPRIAGDRVPVTFKLLSPAQRPVQITRDLASFWRGAYAEVRRDLRGRYPRHYWPEDPLQAAPTRRVRPRK